MSYNPTLTSVTFSDEGRKAWNMMNNNGQLYVVLTFKFENEKDDYTLSFSGVNFHTAPIYKFGANASGLVVQNRKINKHLTQMYHLLKDEEQFVEYLNWITECER